LSVFDFAVLVATERGTAGQENAVNGFDPIFFQYFCGAHFYDWEELLPLK